jgi:hypothetical protein
MTLICQSCFLMHWWQETAMSRTTRPIIGTQGRKSSRVPKQFLTVKPGDVIEQTFKLWSVTSAKLTLPAAQLTDP